MRVIVVPMGSSALYEDMLQLPRAVKFPVELEPPDGFDPERPDTWPRLEGRLEYVDGRLFYMPPCGGGQGEVAVSASALLAEWQSRHPDYVVRGNEAGMILAGSTRAADVAVWRRADLDPRERGLARAAPLLVVEVAGRDDNESYLGEKSRWYLQRGVLLVWLVFPDEREVRVVSRGGRRTYRVGERLDPNPALPELEPEVGRFFAQLSG